ncbi:MAG: LamG-like jellyroll fold domain-containing protein, partial [Myxococcota bacterium]
MIHPRLNTTATRLITSVCATVGLWSLGCGEVTDSQEPAPEGELIDDSFDSFAAGTFEGTEWAGDHLQLAADRDSGEFLSRVFDAGSADAAWSTLSWQTRAPHGRSLPGMGRSDTGYARDAVDMRDNVLLLRMDESEAAGNGQVLTDASGRGNDAVVASGGNVLLPESGLFDGALHDSADTHAFVDLATTRDFDFGAGDFTWALWAKTSQSCQEENRVFMGSDGDGSGQDRVHLWLGCAHHTRSSCSDGQNGGRAAGTFIAGAGEGFCGQSRINDGQWHHLAIVKSGHSPATLTLYVDGRVEMTNQVNFVRD